MHTQKIDLKTARTSLEELLALIETGSEVLLLQGDIPVARLVPMNAPSRPRILGLHAHLGQAQMSDDFTDSLPDDFWLGDE
jgi:antitoxin (DNA-binding transcriptional repressor) of toxin-antitoxin stability system